MFDFVVTPDGRDEYQVTASTRDILLWEKANRGKTFTEFLDNRSFVDLYRLAHIASKRQGLFDGSLDEFEKTCELGVTETEDEGEEPDPTPPAA